MDAQLDERKVTILKAIIKTYLETGEPVGSRTFQVFGTETQFCHHPAMRCRTWKRWATLYSHIHQQDVFLLIRDTGSTLTRSCRRKKTKSQNLRM